MNKITVTRYMVNADGIPMEQTIELLLARKGDVNAFPLEINGQEVYVQHFMTIGGEQPDSYLEGIKRGNNVLKLPLSSGTRVLDSREEYLSLLNS